VFIVRRSRSQQVPEYKGPLIGKDTWWRGAHRVATGQRASLLASTDQVRAAARAGQPAEVARRTARRYGARLPDDATYGQAIDITTQAQKWVGRRRLRRLGLLEQGSPASPRRARRRGALAEQGVSSSGRRLGQR
jgi:hypothetical protein